MGRRADVVLLHQGIIFVIEYKVGETSFSSHAIDQTLGYALDLKNFHETSHSRRITPILVATEGSHAQPVAPLSQDDVSAPVLTNSSHLVEVITSFGKRFADTPVDATSWASGRYKPTPTIVEAAQALYRGHDVQEISRSEAGAENLSATAAYISQVIDRSKAEHKKSICFVTGVPGSGKTLAGLNIANERMKAHEDEHAVFLSGNGPLVDVLREALTDDALRQAREKGLPRPSRASEYQRACAFIQNIHHFRDDNLQTARPPIEKVVVFDEAQRAWNMEQTSQFMRQKRGQVGFSMSEPEFLLSVMDRHPDWCTVVCLVGGGQEINTGEAGIKEWLSALTSKFQGWDVHISDQVLGRQYLAEEEDQALLKQLPLHTTSHLHLAVSVRSFRAEHVSNFVGALIDGDVSRAREIATTLTDYPIYVTRNLDRARAWLRSRRRGMERAGLLASSNALRLKPEGIYVKAKIDPPLWFLAPRGDVRSSDALEDVATEFDVQGLELDWTCVCWDANFRWVEHKWEAASFKGTKWQRVGDPSRKAYLANAYRVLLTRARQGMVIFVPLGDQTDPTRPLSFYDDIYEVLLKAGIRDLSDFAIGPARQRMFGTKDANS
ncbi:hypothetical protein DC522_03260 [Microvirga sp. KLBC 81]|nr:hypothetical protein DC522_03260 [Microvirga sp. KLBC 81]